MMMDNNKSVALVKVDTTGLFDGFEGAPDDEILSVAVIDGEGRALLDTYIKPEHHDEWPDAMEVNHITPETVAGAPVFAEVAPDIRRILDSADLVTGWNLDFELRAMRCEFERLSLVGPWACGFIYGNHWRLRDLIDEYADACKSETLLPLTHALDRYWIDVDDPVEGETRALTIARATLEVARAMDDADYRKRLRALYRERHGGANNG